MAVAQKQKHDAFGNETWPKLCDANLVFLNVKSHVCNQYIPPVVRWMNSMAASKTKKLISCVSKHRVYQNQQIQLENDYKMVGAKAIFRPLKSIKCWVYSFRKRIIDIIFVGGVHQQKSWVFANKSHKKQLQGSIDLQTIKAASGWSHRWRTWNLLDLDGKQQGTVGWKWLSKASLSWLQLGVVFT